jgi:hypothetical protein
VPDRASPNGRQIHADGVEPALEGWSDAEGACGMEKQSGARLRRYYRHVLRLCLILATLPAAAQVGPLTYQNLFFDQVAQRGDMLAVEAGLIYTDNATFSSNASSDTVGVVGLIGNLVQDGERFDYRVDSDIAAVKYFHDTYQVEPTGYFDGTADFKIVPGSLSWLGRETYTQLVLNPYAPVTPDNLENLNYVTTGPRFTLRPTLRTTVTLDLLYSYVDSHSPSPLFVNIDNHRYGGTLKMSRAFSSTASLYLKGSYEKVDFTDTAINNDFTLAQGNAGYKLEDARTVLDISAGYAQLRQFEVPVTIETAVGARETLETKTYSAPSWTLDLTRLVTPTQRVALFASQRLLDFATGWQLDFDQAVPTIAPAEVALGAPFTQRIFGADWRWQAPRTTFDFAVVDTSQHYHLTLSNERSPISPYADRDLKDFSAVVARRLSSMLTWDLGVHFEHQDLADGPSSNYTTELTNLRWRIGRRTTLRFLFAHTQYLGIRDDQIGVTVSYAVVEGGQPGGTGPGAAPLLPGVAPIAPTSMMPQP